MRAAGSSSAMWERGTCLLARAVVDAALLAGDDLLRVVELVVVAGARTVGSRSTRTARLAAAGLGQEGADEGVVAAADGLVDLAAAPCKANKA